MKRCNRCGTEKPLSEFHRRAKASDGLQAQFGFIEHDLFETAVSNLEKHRTRTRSAA